MPQGSVLGSLRFNIDLIDLFYEYEESNIASYADGTILYSCTRDTQTVISELKFISSNFFHWFQYNHLIDNLGKCHLLLSSETPTDISVGDASIKTSEKETQLRILIDLIVSTFMSFNKRRTLMKAFFESQFNDCYLI